MMPVRTDTMTGMMLLRTDILIHMMPLRTNTLVAVATFSLQTIGTVTDNDVWLRLNTDVSASTVVNIAAGTAYCSNRKI